VSVARSIDGRYRLVLVRGGRRVEVTVSAREAEELWDALTRALAEENKR
jgi:hypothetical protein